MRSIACSTNTTTFKLIYPVHLNPVVREIADEILGDNPRVHLIEPLEVIDFHNFAAASHIILTDSGGIQEEAPSLGKPVIVLRDTTERPEGIEANTLKLAGTDEETIFSLTDELLTNPDEYNKMAPSLKPIRRRTRLRTNRRSIKEILNFIGIK